MGDERIEHFSARHDPSRFTPNEPWRLHLNKRQPKSQVQRRGLRRAARKDESQTFSALLYEPVNTVCRGSFYLSQMSGLCCYRVEECRER